MSEVTRLIVVRHGNTFNSGDVILRVGSATDLPLTEKGMLQGVAVGRALAEQQINVDYIFHAPLQRTCQSAVGIAQSFPEAILAEEEFLTELDYGADDGKPENEVVLHLGAVEMRSQITEKTTIDELMESGKAALKKWDSEAVLPQAWYFLEERAASLEKDWLEFGKKIQTAFAGKTVVAVTSNGIARFSKVLLPESETLSGSLKLATGAFGIYEFDGSNWKCAAWNCRPEL